MPAVLIEKFLRASVTSCPHALRRLECFYQLLRDQMADSIIHTLIERGIAVWQFQNLLGGAKQLPVAASLVG